MQSEANQATDAPFNQSQQLSKLRYAQTEKPAVGNSILPLPIISLKVYSGSQRQVEECFSL